MQVVVERANRLLVVTGPDATSTPQKHDSSQPSFEWSTHQDLGIDGLQVCGAAGGRLVPLLLRLLLLRLLLLGGRLRIDTCKLRVSNKSGKTMSR